MRPEVALERLKNFQTLRAGPDHDLGLWFGFRRRLRVIGCVTRGEARRRQILPYRWLEFERFARRRCKGIRHGVERELSGVTDGGYDGGGSEEVHGLDIPVVPRAEIPVEGGEDGYERFQHTIGRIC